MRTPDIEGVAIHGGPESCAAMEPRITVSGCRRRLTRRKATLPAALARAVRWTPRGLRTWACTEVLMRENREIPLLARPVDRWAGRPGNVEAVSLG